MKYILYDFNCDDDKWNDYFDDMILYHQYLGYSDIKLYYHYLYDEVFYISAYKNGLYFEYNKHKPMPVFDNDEWYGDYDYCQQTIQDWLYNDYDMDLYYAMWHWRDSGKKSKYIKNLIRYKKLSRINGN